MSLRLYVYSMYVCVSVCLSVCPSVRLSVCPSVRLSVCPSVRLSVCPSVGLSVCRSEDRRMDGWMYVCLCVCVCDSFSHPKADCTWPPQWSPASSPNIARHARQPLPFWPQTVQIALEVLKLKSCNDTETVGEFDKNHESWRSKNGWMFYPLYPYKIYKVWGCMRHIISSLWGEVLKTWTKLWPAEKPTLIPPNLLPCKSWRLLVQTGACSTQLVNIDYR